MYMMHSTFLYSYLEIQIINILSNINVDGGLFIISIKLFSRKQNRTGLRITFQNSKMVIHGRYNVLAIIHLWVDLLNFDLPKIEIILTVKDLASILVYHYTYRSGEYVYCVSIGYYSLYYNGKWWRARRIPELKPSQHVWL
jgi:hypothetical protein